MMMIIILIILILAHVMISHSSSSSSIPDNNNNNNNNYIFDIKQFMQYSEALLYVIYPYFNSSSSSLDHYPFHTVSRMLLNEKQVSQLKMTECPENMKYLDPRLLSDVYRTSFYLDDNNNIGFHLNKLNCLLNEEIYREKASRILAVISYQRKLYGYAIYHAINSLSIYPMDRFLIEVIGLSLQELNLPLNTTFYNTILKLSYMHQYNHDSTFRLIQIPNNDREIYNQLLKDRPIAYGEQFNTNFLQSYILNSALTQQRNNVCEAKDTSLQQELYRLCDKLYNLQRYTPKITVDWSHLSPVKLLCSSLPSLDGSNFHNIFDENCQGLSDSLWLIDIPNEIVSSVTTNDESLYILFYNYPIPSLLKNGYNLIPRNYIIYNQEKNAQVQSKHTYPDIGFDVKCTADVSIDNFTYPTSFVTDSLLIWEYSQCNIPTWNSAGKKVFYMPQPLSHQMLSETCQKLKMEKLFDVNSYSTNWDALFYGTYSEYRQNFHEMAAEFATMKLYNTNTKMISSQTRDRNIDMAKVVLNLRSCEALDGHLNSHRIRHLLGKAKLVISDRSGCYEEEKLYIENNAIAIGDNYYSIFQLIQRLLKNKDEAQKYEMSGFIYILKDIVIDLFEKDIGNDSCQNSKSFIIQLYCSMEYTKTLLLDKMNIKEIDSNDMKLLWKKRLYENPTTLNI